MFTLPRRIVYVHNLKSLALNLRCICSDQSQHVQITQSFNESESKNISKKKDYGEKEIFLLDPIPIDMRTPLPGNTGIVPLASRTQDPKYTFLPHSKVFSTIIANSAEERHKNGLAQLAYTAVESVLSSASSLECSLHECPQLLKKDFSDLFPNLDMRNERLVVLTLCQKTEQDMKVWSEDMETERSSLEECFLITAKAICSSLRYAGYWADFINPSTGKPAYAGTSKATMFDTDIRYSYFGFTIEDLGCCKVISHHLWGTHSFVGAIFTNAPLDSSEIQAIMSKNSLNKA